MVDRVNTGIKGLNDHIQGGFPEKSLTLVTGGPGSGKTTFCIQFVNEGLQNNEKCLYITTGQRIHEIKADAEEYGFNLEDENLAMAHISPSNNVAENIRKQISNESFDRVVLDSLSVFEMNWGEKDHLRKYINKLMEHFREIESTVVVTSERPDKSGKLSRFGIAEFIVDGVILLNGFALGDTNYRSAQVVKMRKTKIDGSMLTVSLEEDGMHIEEDEKL